MESFIIKALQFFLSISILVVLHELGHFIPAKLFGTRVEKFYLFFDPWFSLFKVKKGDTEYGIGWLPLGGYVKISGMIDESMDTEQMKQEPQPWEFRSKPAWQRLIIMIGGVTVNLILAMIIYAGVAFAYGDRYLPNESLTDGVWVTDSLGTKMGVENGDKFVTINGKKPEKFGGIMAELIYGGEFTIERDGRQITQEVPKTIVESLIDKGAKTPVFLPRIPFIISSIPDTSQNVNAGLQQGDRVIGINGEELLYFDEYKERLDQYRGQNATLLVEREGSTLELVVTISQNGYIEVVPAMLRLAEMEEMGLYKLAHIEYGFFESIPAGIEKALTTLENYVRQFQIIFDTESGGWKGLGGFGTLGSLFSPTWDWEVFWTMTAWLSVVLAFMNILPIPALDGGHVMFTLYEMISGRKPNEKVLEYAQMAGVILLLSLLVFANGNDIYRTFF